MLVVTEFCQYAWQRRNLVVRGDENERMREEKKGQSSSGFGGQLAQPHRDDEDDRDQNRRMLCCGLLAAQVVGSPWTRTGQAQGPMLSVRLFSETKQGSHSRLRGFGGSAAGCLRLMK